MPRTRKIRRCCQALPGREFRPVTAGDPLAPAVELPPDEQETLRLVDLEELDQEAAAARMGISRGTLQRLLYAARRKIVFALLTGRRLVLPGAGAGPCPRTDACRFCHSLNRSSAEKGENVMNTKIAVTCENGQVFQHFGHTPEFAVFTVEDGKITRREVLPTGGTGHGALAGFLKENGVNLLLCGGIGGGAQVALAEAGVDLIGGVSGPVDAAVTAYLQGRLQTAADFQCHHHDHEAGHACGNHGCGGNSCH